MVFHPGKIAGASSSTDGRKRTSYRHCSLMRFQYASSSVELQHINSSLKCLDYTSTRNKMAGMPWWLEHSAILTQNHEQPFCDQNT